MNQLKNAQVQTNMPSQGKMQSQRETQSANNVVQPNQVNFAVPNMNPQTRIELIIMCRWGRIFQVHMWKQQVRSRCPCLDF